MAKDKFVKMDADNLVYTVSALYRSITLSLYHSIIRIYLHDRHPVPIRHAICRLTRCETIPIVHAILSRRPTRHYPLADPLLFLWAKDAMPIDQAHSITITYDKILK